MKAILALIVVRYCASASPPDAGYTTFEDPVEHAFTVDVPEGWIVEGGVFRVGYFDARPMVEIKNRGGTFWIRLGDYGIPPYSIPDRAHPQEGITVDLEAQAQVGIAKCRGGPEFALRYGNARFKNFCDKLEVISHPPVPIKFNVPPRDDIAQESEGQVFYSCKTREGGNLAAFLYARTTLSKPAPGQPQLWSVTGLVSCIGAGDFPVWEIASHVAASFRVKPQWIEYQKKMDQEGQQVAQMIAQKKMQALGTQVQQFRARMKAMSDQVAGFERGQNRQAQQVQGFSNALNGITRTHDPLTGQYREVWSGQSDQYWVNSAGQVVSSANSPGPSFHQLQTVR